MWESDLEDAAEANYFKSSEEDQSIKWMYASVIILRTLCLIIFINMFLSKYSIGVYN